MMTATYLNIDIIREGIPLPSPSSAPEAVTDTEDTINPALIILKAAAPADIVVSLEVNNPISVSGIHKHTAVPIHIITRTMPVAVAYIFLTRFASPAP